MDRKKRVLVVDDEETIVQILQRKLNESGFEVLTAMNGREALERVDSFKPDAFLIDILMPVLNGIEVLKILRAKAAFASAPILLISALQEKEDIVRGFESGASDYITKPFIFEEILARLAAHLRTKDALDELKREREDQNALFETLREVSGCHDLKGIVSRVAEMLESMVTIEEVSILMAGDKMRMISVKGLSKVTEIIPSRESSRDAIKAISSRNVVVSGNTLTIPLIYEGDVFGALSIRKAALEDGFSERFLRHSKMLAFAIAPAIRSAGKNIKKHRGFEAREV